MQYTFHPVVILNWRVSAFVRFTVAGYKKAKLKYENKQIFTDVFHLHEILPTFYYTAIKMTMFRKSKNLLNNKKAVFILKVDLDNKMVLQLWQLG